MVQASLSEKPSAGLCSLRHRSGLGRSIWRPAYRGRCPYVAAPVLFSMVSERAILSLRAGQDDRRHVEPLLCQCHTGRGFGKYHGALGWFSGQVGSQPEQLLSERAGGDANHCRRFPPDVAGLCHRWWPYHVRCSGRLSAPLARTVLSQGARQTTAPRPTHLQDLALRPGYVCPGGPHGRRCQDLRTAGSSSQPPQGPATYVQAPFAPQTQGEVSTPPASILLPTSTSTRTTARGWAKGDP